MNINVFFTDEFPEMNQELEVLFAQIGFEEVQLALQNASHEQIAIVKEFVVANPEKFQRDTYTRELARLVLSAGHGQD